MDFPELSREYSRDGSGLLLVPAWDFVEDGWLHSRMAIMRSVEGGFAMVRSAKQGLLTVNDNRGRVLAQSSSSAAEFATLIASVPVEHPGTLYSRFGDWFAWLMLGTFVLTICIPMKRSRQRVNTTASRSARAT
jgi:apolipoprotein N-acyltransferase